MNELKLSVIVPVYNIAPYIERCLESIRGQTYRNLEIVVVDDGSEDASGGICDRFAAEDGRFRVIHQPNRGTMAARAAGIDAATGELLAFVDGDDWIETDMFEALIGKMGGADLVISGELRELNHGIAQELPYPFDEGVYAGTKFECLMQNAIYDATHGAVNGGTLCGRVFRSALMREVQIRSDAEHYIIYTEDAVVFFQYLLKCESVYITKKCYYHYCYRETSVCHEPRPDALIDIVYGHMILEKIIEQEVEKNRKFNLSRQLRQWTVSLFHYRLPVDICTEPETRCIENILDTAPLAGKRIVLFGAGGCGQDYYRQMCAFRIPPAAWLDSRPRTVFDRQVGHIDTITALDYDLVLLAVSFAATAEDMRAQLLRLGVPEEKIRWQEPLTVLPKSPAAPPAP